jgi:hypothetical protein
MERLKKRARLCLRKPPTRKDELVESLVQRIKDPQFLRQHWAQLKELEQRAVSEAVHAGGRLDLTAFVAKYGSSPWRMSTERGWYPRREEGQPLDLLFFNEMIPSDLVPLLREFVPAPPRFVLPAREDLPERVPVGLKGTQGEVDLLRADTEEAALHDLAATLRLVQEGKVRVSENTGQPTAATVRQLQERLLHGDYFPAAGEVKAEDTIRPFALAMIVQAAGLARPRGGPLELTRKGQAWLDNPTAEGLRQAWDAWVGYDKLDELSRVRAIKGQRSKGCRLTPPSERKGALLEALAQGPVGQWIHRDDFFRAVRAWQCDFEVERTEFSHLYLTEMQYDWLGYADTDYWGIVQGHYLLVVLWEYAATLGLIDVAYTAPEETDFYPESPFEIDTYPFSRYEGFRYFRINALGAYILGHADHYDGPVRVAEPPALNVLPNRDVVITDTRSLTPNDRTFLERIAVPQGDKVYRLQRDQVLDAVEGNVALATIQEFLESKSAHPLPDTVRVFFDDLQRNVGLLVEQGPALVIRATDPYVVKLIENDTALSKLCFTAGDQFIVVPTGHEAAFRRLVRKRGYVVRKGG